jgi:hypothetical protein
MDLSEQPKTLERLLECYWKINRNFILTVLAGDNNPEKTEPTIGLIDSLKNIFSSTQKADSNQETKKTALDGEKKSQT